MYDHLPQILRPFVKENLHKVCYSWLSINPNPNAIPILEKNLDKIHWCLLSRNPHANHILENNIDKVDWGLLSKNPSIFQIDYDVMRENCREMAEEIAKIVWHPSRMNRWPEDNLIDDSDKDSVQNIPVTSTIRTIKMSIRLRS